VAPSTKTSRPGRLLAVLAALLIVMLAGVLRGDVIHPADWHNKFHVGLGLDLSSGTTVTLKAVPPKGNKIPSKGAMTQAISIMTARVNNQGFSGAVVQQQGNQNITVSVPGQGAQKVVAIVGTTAQLRFRQVLLCSGVGVNCVPPSALVQPSSSPSAAASGSASPSTSASPSSSAGAKTSPSPSAGSPSSSAGAGQAVKATKLGSAAAAARAAASASPTASSSAAASPSAAGSAAPSTSPLPSASTPTTAAVTGDQSKVNKATLALFNKLNCADRNWQQKIYGNNSNLWDEPGAQIVACDGTGVKYVLANSPVVGQDLTTASAVLNSSSQWVVSFNLNGKGSSAFADLTSRMFSNYYSNGAETSVLDQFAIVLDGKVVSAPSIQGPITGGTGQITGGGNGFTQGGASQLANVLKYGALPLTFHTQDVSSVSPELGSAQLQAGLIAASIGLLLVVIYSFIYYRGLGLVSVSSLIIAASLSYLSVVLLSKYESFHLTLDGVAGLIVAIGITADSFVVYFERLRDEVREGRTLRTAVERGWTRARRTILVSDTVSFLAAALLYIIAIGDVKGFAFTLGLTTLVDVVVVFLFTKPMVTLLARTKFFGQGHKLSGLDPARLGARSPWRGSRRPPPRPATGTAASASSAQQARTTPKEA
jgi:preprotein translocase subunit SecD